MIKDGFDEIKVSTENRSVYLSKHETKQKRNKSSLQVKLLCINLVILMLSVGFVKYDMDVKQEQEYVYRDSIASSKSDGVLFWVSSFISKDYESCDSVVSDGAYKILSFDGSLASSLSIVSSKLYTLMYNKISDSILSMEVTSFRAVDDGLEYTVSVSFTPYKKISSVSIDTERLEDVCNKYIDKSIDDTEYLSALESIYYKAFSDCFVSSATESTIELKLTEKENENGTKSVYGSKVFLDALLEQTNVRSILSVYEENINKEINKVLIQY